MMNDAAMLPQDRPVQPPAATVSVAPASTEAPVAAPKPDRDLLQSIKVDLEVLIGAVRLPAARLMELGAGDVVDLDHLVGDEVTLAVNGHRVAHGRLIITDQSRGTVGVRITRLVAGEG